MARKEDLLKILQEMVDTLEEAERFAGDDPTNVRDIRDAAFKNPRSDYPLAVEVTKFKSCTCAWRITDFRRKSVIRHRNPARPKLSARIGIDSGAVVVGAGKLRGRPSIS